MPACVTWLFFLSPVATVTNEISQRILSTCWALRRTVNAMLQPPSQCISEKLSASHFSQGRGWSYSVIHLTCWFSCHRFQTNTVSELFQNVNGDGDCQSDKKFASRVMRIGPGCDLVVETWGLVAQCTNSLPCMPSVDSKRRYFLHSSTRLVYCHNTRTYRPISNVFVSLSGVSALLPAASLNSRISPTSCQSSNQHTTVKQSSHLVRSVDGGKVSLLVLLDVSAAFDCCQC